MLDFAVYLRYMPFHRLRRLDKPLIILTEMVQYMYRIQNNLPIFATACACAKINTSHRCFKSNPSPIGRWYAYALMGTVNRRGYGAQQKGTIGDARGPYPLIWCTLKPFFTEFDWFVVITSPLDACISRYGNFCANDNDDNNNDITDYFTPLRMHVG